MFAFLYLGYALLRLRHAAARHGEQYEHDEAAFQYCFVSLRHLLLSPLNPFEFWF